MTKPSDKTLSELLVKYNLLSAEEAQKFLNEIKSSNQSLYSHLVRRNILTDEQILQTLSTALVMEVVSLKDLNWDKAVSEKVPVKLATYYNFFPVKIDGKVITLALCVPPDMKTQDEIRVYLGLEPKIVLAKEKEIQDALKKHYGLAAETIDRILTQESAKKTFGDFDSGTWVEDIEKAEDASVAKLINQIILEAYQKRATDIHIEPYRNKVRLRYRIDGILVDGHLPPEAKQFLLPMLSRIKIMANLSIVEKRLPQDGSAVVKTKDQDLDLRVSTIPTPRGESIVIRILPTKVMLFSLEKLGLDKTTVHVFRELLKRPHGIIFATGPTGSGKTTTLYACLNEISSPQRKIITIEDPIEYEMEGITQIQVNPKVQFNFSTGLRSILRHDPDIIMVGEVRDLETAEIAIRTALTGHLVFSTLHTNDAASGITRLIEMGLEPYLVASSVEAFVAQRLVRLICPACKEEMKTPLTDIKEEIATALKLERGDQIKIYRGKGCDQCNHTGFYGRTAIYEILVIDEEIRSSVLEKPRAEEIKRIAMKGGMITLRQNGWKKVLEGLTTPAEVVNVTSPDNWPPKRENKESVAVQPQPSSPPPAARSLASVYRVISKDVLQVANEYESRIYPRIAAAVNVRYRLLKTDAQEPNVLQADNVEYAALTLNISAGGLAFNTVDPVPPDAILLLQIHLDKNERGINCLSKVGRIEENQVTGQSTVIVYYLDISSGDRAKLGKFVKALDKAN